MLKKDKLNLVLRAKHGSQILKYLNPAGPIGNLFMISTGLPKAKLAPVDLSDIEELPIDPLSGIDMRSSWQRRKDKINDWSKKHMKEIGAVSGLVANGIVNLTGKDVTNSSGVDTGFLIADTVSGVLGKINPVLGAGASGLTTIAKGINNIWASKSKEFGINQSTVSQVGGSYGGSVSTINDAASKAGKKYGLFSIGAKRRANDLIDKATEQQNMMTEIAAEASDQKSMINDFAYMRNQMNLEGGYDQRYMRAAKSGMKIQDRIDFVKYRRLQSRINVNTKQIEEFKDGGVIKSEWKPVIDNFSILKKGGSIKPGWVPVIDEIIIHRDGGNVKKPRTLELLIAYAKELNPRFIQRLSEPVKDIELGNGKKGTHLMSWATDDDNAIIYSEIQEDDNGNLTNYGNKALDRALEKKNFLIMTPEEAKLFTENYKQGWPKFFFKDVYDYYKDYDLSNAILIRDNLVRTEGNKIYVNTDEDAVHELWHFLSQNKPNEKYKEFYDNLNDNRISELGGNLNFVKRFEGDPGHFYHPSELEARIMAAKFKSLGLTYNKEFFKNLRTNENKYGYNMRDLLYMFNDENLEKIFNLKKGGALGEELETPEIEETNQKNIIPEGALHKNKHHMEHTEGLTQKGIPVIDNEGEQLAEIELDEIIFTLEVTKKLEELYKDGSDKAAIEAGKLLVKEILFNTDDRTGLINKCKKGGKL